MWGKWLEWLIRSRIYNTSSMWSLACSDGRLSSDLCSSIHYFHPVIWFFPLSLLLLPSNECVCRNFRKHLRMVGSRRMKAQSESQCVPVYENVQSSAWLTSFVHCSFVSVICVLECTCLLLCLCKCYVHMDCNENVFQCAWVDMSISRVGDSGWSCSSWW